MTSARWSTYGVQVGPCTVLKRFPREAGEHQGREWWALELLAENAPGLAPSPLECGTDESGGFIRMSRVPGEPLRGQVLNQRQTEGLVEAVDTLHRVVLPSTLATVRMRPTHQAGVIAQIRRWQSADLPGKVRPGIQRALDAGTTWLDEQSAKGLDTSALPPVFGPGDGNLANYLWDGERVRVVDFEAAGRSDRPYEIAEITEHVSSWRDSTLDVPAFLRLLRLGDGERERLRDCRRLLALVWLFLLVMDDPVRPRNPSGTADLQAERLLALLERPGR